MSSVEINGATIHYEDGGKGPVLLLVHGGLGAGSEWKLIADDLADSFRVITPDSRGHGQSTNPSRELSYELLADDLAAFARELRLERPVVVGWSDGGQVAMELLVRHPGVAGALVVGGAYPDFEQSGLQKIHQELMREIEANPDDPELAELSALQDDWKALLVQTKALWTEYSGLSDDEVAAIEAPMLVLAADGDEIVSLDLALKLRDAVPNAELAVVPRSGHESPFTPERASLFSAVLRDFATRCLQEESTNPATKGGS